MIKSFRCRDTERVFERQFVRKFPRDIQPRAFMKLNAIDAAARLDDLRLPPSNRLELLKGTRRGQYSIRINSQWRVCFTWRNGTRNKSKSWIIIEEALCPKHKSVLSIQDNILLSC